VSDELASLTSCLGARVGAWFEQEGRREISDPTHLRQMNMTIALAASRWNELARRDDAVLLMRGWLAEIERRAQERNARARVEGIRRVREWLEDCARGAARRHSASW
jgi:hypothetical protein